jgi:hypothetical protein
MILNAYLAASALVRVSRAVPQYQERNRHGQVRDLGHRARAR